MHSSVRVNGDVPVLLEVLEVLSDAAGGAVLQMRDKINVLLIPVSP